MGETFPVRQFHIDGYSPPYRIDRYYERGGIIIYVREDVPSKLTEIGNSIEGTLFELNLHKKWLLGRSYISNKFHFTTSQYNSKNLDTLLINYDVFLTVDFNVDKNHVCLNNSCLLYNFKHLIKVPLVIKTYINSSFINLLLTKSHCSFQTRAQLRVYLRLS